MRQVIISHLFHKVCNGETDDMCTLSANPSWRHKSLMPDMISAICLSFGTDFAMKTEELEETVNKEGEEEGGH